MGQEIEGLGNFRWVRFRLTYRARDSLLLPAYKGSTFRGPFGHHFRRLVCTRDEHEKCGLCPLHEVCPYALVFEPSPPQDARMMQRFSDIPRPFVFEPDRDEKRDYAMGEIFSFHFLVFGRTIQFFPYFVLTFRDFGEDGIGKGRGKVVLQSVDFTEPDGETNVYREGDNLVRTGWTAQSGQDLLNQPLGTGGNLTLQFQTMTRLTHAGHFAEIPTFPILIRNLARRISALLAFYHDTPLELDYAALFARAESIQLLQNETSWQEWGRYSRRQQEPMQMGGLVGTATYQTSDKEGFAPFLPFLCLGEIAHVGKGAVFGLGKYEISNKSY